MRQKTVAETVADEQNQESHCTRTTITRIDRDHDRTIWLEQCESARGIEAQFGVQQALSYLIGEKFLDFLEATDEDATLRADLPAFVVEIKSIFESWQLAEYLETVRETEPFDPSIYDDEETTKMERKLDIRRSAADLLLVERAREWLLEE